MPENYPALRTTRNPDLERRGKRGRENCVETQDKLRTTWD